MLTGLLELDGVAMTDRRVLLISGDTTRLLASTTTNDQGRFSFPLPEPAETRVVVLTKIQGPVLSIAYRAIDLAMHGSGPHRISIDSTTDLFHSINTHIALDEGRPPYLLVHLDPVHLTGIPEPLEKFFRTVDEDVIDSWFSQFLVEGDSLDIRVQNGTYRIDAQYFNKSGARQEEIANYCVKEVTSDGEETIHFTAPFESFTLNVDRDREVEMTVGPIETEP
jgi:hypothetical protein